MAKVRTRKRGKTWSYAFEAGKKEDGKRQVIEKGGFATSDEAYEAGAKAYISYRHGDVGITSERILFKDFYDIYMKRKAEERSEKAIYMLDKNLQKHVLPFFGKMILQDIRPRNVDSWIRNIAKQGYAKGTMDGLLSQLSLIFKFAVYPCEIIGTNPAQYIKVPEQSDYVGIERKVISATDLDTLLKRFPFGHPYHMLLVIAYHTGMRISEIFGLEWENVDLTNGVIKVRTQIKERTSKDYELSKVLKTKGSKRDVLLPVALIDVLKQWKEVQSNDTSPNRVCNYIDDNGLIRCASRELIPEHCRIVNLVCTTRKGSFHTRSGISKALKKVGFNMHSFRHTHATMLISSGALPKGVAARLGHESLVTQNIYSHNTEKLQADTLAIFEKSLADKSGVADKMQTKKGLAVNKSQPDPDIADFLGIDF